MYVLRYSDNDNRSRMVRSFAVSVPADAPLQFVSGAYLVDDEFYAMWVWDDVDALVFDDYEDAYQYLLDHGFESYAEPVPRPI